MVCPTPKHALLIPESVSDRWPTRRGRQTIGESGEEGTSGTSVELSEDNAMRRNLGACGANGVLMIGHAEGAWVVKKCKREGLRPAALLRDDDLWQEGKLVEAGSPQREVGMRTLHWGKYIDRTCVLKCAHDNCFYIGVQITIGTTMRSLRPTQLQQSVSDRVRTAPGTVRSKPTETSSPGSTPHGSRNRSGSGGSWAECWGASLETSIGGDLEYGGELRRTEMDVRGTHEGPFIGATYIGK